MSDYSVDNFFATAELRDEFLRFRRMSEEERKAFGEYNKARLQAMSEEEKAEYDKQMLYGLQAIKQETEELFLFEQMNAITKYISLSQVAQDYFGKSRHWLYQRLKGLVVNGKRAQFTPEERRRLSDALLDISRQIQETAFKIA